MSTISPHKPEDWPRQFVEHPNAGDLDAVMSLYEAEACSVTHSGETLVGRDAIRKVLGGLIEAKTQFQSRVVRTAIVVTPLSCTQTLKGQESMTPGRLFRFATRRSKFCAGNPTAAGSKYGAIQTGANEDRDAGVW